MKHLLVLIPLITSISMTAQTEKASTTKKTFSRETTVITVINADAATVWNVLTDASTYAERNSTIVSFSGNIAEGEKVQLVSTLDPSRTFKIKVKEMSPHTRMVWGDAMGERVYLLSEIDGKTKFTMTERIGGLMFPLFANKIPSFDESFDQYASDLKKAVEAK